MSAANELITNASAGERFPRLSGGRLLILALGLLLIVVSMAVGIGLGRGQSPTTNSAAPEVGFARDMAIHHAQAVDMAVLLRDRSEDPEMRQLALDMLLTQQAQIGQLRGWLAVWELPQASTEPAMTWMGMPTTGLMPGLATAEQLTALRGAAGVTADGLFLQLMITHHRAGVAMAQEILKHDPSPAVRNLAGAIVMSQQNEITYMQDLLEQKGFPPVSDVPDGGHENTEP